MMITTKLNKVYRKRKLSSGDIEYYLHWADKPAKSIDVGYIGMIYRQHYKSI